MRSLREMGHTMKMTIDSAELIEMLKGAKAVAVHDLFDTVITVLHTSTNLDNALKVIERLPLDNWIDPVDNPVDNSLSQSSGSKDE